MKTRQGAKIRELGHTLFKAGITRLDDQAEILGLSRSTTWTLLKGNHKSSGLSARVINRILSARRLPSAARAKVLEYVEDKTAGHYGHSKLLRRRFIARISAKSINPAQLEAILNDQPDAKIVTTTLAPDLEDMHLLLERRR
jgi:hypothetical protein